MALKMFEAFQQCWLALGFALAVPLLLKVAMKLSMQDVKGAVMEVSWSDYVGALGLMLLALLLKELKEEMKSVMEYMEHLSRTVVEATQTLHMMERSIWSAHCTMKHVESRLERLVQEGCESVRHIVQIFVEFDLKRADGSVRWPKRRLLEEQAAWSSARARFNELGTMEAFQLVVEAARRQVKADIADMRAKCREDWLPEVEKEEQTAEAERLEVNLKHLAKHDAMFVGKPEVEDVQKEMLKLMKEWMAMRGMPEANLEDAFFTTATSFLARDLKVYDGESC